MSALSSIEWTDRTWNPVRGCSIVSPGCHNCYAMKFAHRFSGPSRPYEGLTKQTKAGPQWTGKVRYVPEVVGDPLRWKKPSRIFVNSMSDLFHDDVTDKQLIELFAVMANAREHTFQILTKRPTRMLDFMSQLKWGLGLAFLDVSGVPTCFANLPYMGDSREYWESAWAGNDTPIREHAGFAPPNIWLGVSCEDQQRADERIPLLLKTPAAVRFVSAEPLLGPIRFDSPVLEADSDGNIDWVIVGGESGPGARSCDVGWIHSIIEEGRECSVPVFVKQLGSKPTVGDASFCAGDFGGGVDDACCDIQGRVFLSDSKGGDPSEWPTDLRVRQFPAGVTPIRRAR